MRGSGAGSGRTADVYLPSEISVKTRFAVSSVRVELMWSTRTARITTVARRNRFWIARPAEYTRLDRIAPLFPVMVRLLPKPGSRHGPNVGSPVGEAPIRQRQNEPVWRAIEGWPRNADRSTIRINSALSIRSFHPAGQILSRIGQNDGILRLNRRIRPGVLACSASSPDSQIIPLEFRDTFKSNRKNRYGTGNSEMV
jgi:hypothetical protein